MRKASLATFLTATLIFTSLLVPPASAKTLASNGSECTIIGTEKAETIFGTYASDVICGLGGNDVIYGSSGNDVIDGGSGNDRISGGAGHDQISGGRGSDYIDGGTGLNRCVRDTSDRPLKNCKAVLALPKAPGPSAPPPASTQSPSVSATVSPSASSTVSPGGSQTSSSTASSTTSSSTGSSSSPSGGGSSPSAPSSGSTTTPPPVTEQATIPGSYAGGSSPISNNANTSPGTTTTSQTSTPITLDFEAGAVGLVGFGGDGASVDAHPAGGSAGSTKAIKVVRGNETFAGTIFHIAGNGVNLISANNKTVTLNFYSPAANQPVLLKLEDSANAAKSIETLATATSVGWQTLSFNFDNLRSGTTAYDSTTQYRRAVIFYAFGSNASGSTYYLDQVSFPAVTTTTITIPGPTISYTQGNLLWEENFDGSGALNSSRWTSRYCGQTAGNGGGACYNNEQQYYLPEANQLDGQGNAVITARKITSAPSSGTCGAWSGTCPFTSGRFDTQGKVSFKYGVIEARIRNPLGGANWPAFWMLGTDITSVAWPASGEIDIMEGKSASRVAGAIHWSNNNNDAYEVGEAAGGNFANAYHIYKIYWLENYLAIFVDGVKILEETNTTLNQSGSWAFNKPFFIILNNAISPAGGFSDLYDGWTTSQMKIDYVRHYQLNGQGQVFNN